ncbi:MAG: hypothetical protein JNM12_08770 [Alphaproteobacteria bacterium]|nr:hypothetical protein [Alphaproteobacteria bacterium]
MPNFIAERKLLCSVKGSESRKEIIIRIGAPYPVQDGSVSFPVGEEGCAACHIEIEGLEETYPEIYGADSLQAITLATNAIEPFLRRLQKRYDLFYLNGEAYFDD